jgi:hypothetical protein
MRQTIKAVVGIAVFAFAPPAQISAARAQGSAGTGSTSTGIGPLTGPSGPGRRGDQTQQPGTATNTGAGRSNLSTAQKNAIPPPNAPANAIPR